MADHGHSNRGGRAVGRAQDAFELSVRDRNRNSARR